MLAIALIHLLDVIGKVKETPYLGVMYIALTVASVAVGFYLLHTGSALAWAAAGLVAGATLAGFILSRTTGLPNASDDIGNWTETLGLASMFVEGAALALAGYARALARHERRPGVHASVPRGRSPRSVDLNTRGPALVRGPLFPVALWSVLSWRSRGAVRR